LKLLSILLNPQLTTLPTHISAIEKLLKSITFLSRTASHHWRFRAIDLELTEASGIPERKTGIRPRIEVLGQPLSERCEQTSPRGQTQLALH
jgi:hypothetical protein